MYKILMISLCSLLIFGCTTKNKQSEFDYQTSDQGLINLLVQQGSNPAKIHYISFFIDCKSQQVVTDISQKGVLLGFEDDYINFSDKDQLWSTSLNMSMPLTLNEVTTYRNKLMPIIPAGACKHVGWGSAVVK
ncbi:ribonuclease E inhibitor RraB [Psychrosphaera sp. F3M07]|uniref:ribonuclease E inhibitor RraB n=1 Tax=Psychrosphaera sp. F3M07 TaxID=2841560 RepID=UPI001C091A12|nr:ribonuclease E inhibitor RraB [Psychrosphaera sp. F3M07]MBU2918322.1 ribonuclease E inhibitor RraB [Psychrosphaera sp. F3M07]